MMFFSLCFFASAAFCCIGGDSYFHDYCKQLKTKAGIVVSFSSENVRILDKEECVFFTFGTLYKNLPGLPMFKVGAEVAVSQDCIAYLTDKEGASSLPANGKYDIPYSASWMMNNCGAAWSRWYVDNAPGVTSENMRLLSKEEQDRLKKEISELRKVNEKCIENNALTEKAGCDCIYVVTIPHVGKINFCSDSPTNHIPFCESLHTESLECHAVELYNGSIPSCMRMLLFLDGNHTDIDECLSKIVENIHFDFSE